LTHHLFRVAEAFLESALDDVEYTAGLADVMPQAGSCATGEQIARFETT
jgi:hypothetical protein